MRIIQNRPDFLAGLSAAGAASLLGTRGTLADEDPPEVTTIRRSLALALAVCEAADSGRRVRVDPASTV
jgi:NitT/TauT family transport system substrate-binding protein